MKPGLLWVTCFFLSAFLPAEASPYDTIIVQQNPVICAGNPQTLSLNFAPVTGVELLPPGSEFEYSFSLPAPGWETGNGGWTTGFAPFGNQPNGDPPDFDYITFWPSNVPDHSDGFDLYLRKTIDLTGQDLSNVHWHLGVDNGFALYINGVQVAAGFDGNYTYRWEYEGTILPSLLNPGINVVAVKLMDNGGLTAFDMMIESKPVCPCAGVLWSTGDTTAVIQVAPLLTTKYFVTVTDGTNITRDSVTVFVNHPSAQELHATICEGQSHSGHTLSGIYQDTLVAAGGCDSVQKLYLTVLPPLEPKLPEKSAICSEDSLRLDPGIFDSYTWQDGSHQRFYMVRTAGIYQVMVSNTCGSASGRTEVLVTTCDIYFPTAFTPNRDGRNDFFRILYAYHISDYHLSVFNVWGQKIFETRDPSRGWDGTLGGEWQPTGVYAWYAEFRKEGITEKITRRGTVALLR